MIKYTYLLILLLLLGITGVMAQTVKISDVTALPGDISVPVTMSSFTGANGNVKTIQFQISFDSDLLYFKGITVVDGSFTNWVFPENGAVSPITINCIYSPGKDFPVGNTTPLIALKFGYAGGAGFNGSISFIESGCEITKGNAVTMTNVTYLGGGVTQTSSSATASFETPQTASTSSKVLLPVRLSATNFKTLTFKIGYDPTKLVFVKDTLSVLSGLTTNASNGVVTATWSSLSPTSSAGQLFVLKFIYNGGGDANVTYKPGSQLTGNFGAIIPTSFSTAVVQNNGTSTIAMTSVSAALNDNISIPVSLTYVDGTGYVGAVDLKIGYNTSVLDFTGTTASAISGYTATASGGVIRVVWNGNSASLLRSGTYLSLKFKVVGFVSDPLTASPLTFNAGSIVSRTNLSNVTLNYTNGSVSNPITGPADQDIAIGGSAAFTVTALGSSSWQWQVSTNGGTSFSNLANGGTNPTYSGVLTASMSLTNAVSGMNNYQYRCVVQPGNAASNSALLTVHAATATITDQPDNITVNLGANPSFTVTATGGTSFVWWYKPAAGSWSTLTIAPPYGVSTVGTTSTLTITGALAAMNGSQYRCSILPGAPVVSFEATLTVNPLTVNVKVILQGALDLATPMTMPMRTDLNSGGYLPTSQPYIGSPWNYNPTPSVPVTTIPNANVVDWILVELRSTASGAAITNGRQVGFLLKDGSLVGLSGSGPLAFPLVEAGSYFIVIKHRNHLAIMSKLAQSLNSISPVYDFTTDPSSAYGTNGMATLPLGRYGMWGADVNNDNYARYNGADNDRLAIFNAVGLVVTNGYLQIDINMNGIARYNGSDNDRLAIVNCTGSAIAVIVGQVP